MVPPQQVASHLSAPNKIEVVFASLAVVTIAAVAIIVSYHYGVLSANMDELEGHVNRLRGTVISLRAAAERANNKAAINYRRSERWEVLMSQVNQNQQAIAVLVDEARIYNKLLKQKE